LHARLLCGLRHPRHGVTAPDLIAHTRVPSRERRTGDVVIAIVSASRPSIARLTSVICNASLSATCHRTHHVHSLCDAAQNKCNECIFKAHAHFLGARSHSKANALHGAFTGRRIALIAHASSMGEHKKKSACNVHKGRQQQLFVRSICSEQLLRLQSEPSHRTGEKQRTANTSAQRSLQSAG
jgi:hypothetical protein